MDVQAAAISIQSSNFIVVVVSMDLVTNSGEGNMAIDSMQPKFGGAPVVLMAQRDDGSPVYFGDANLVKDLQEIPVDEMPWKVYSI
jgi:hypothetical protein